MTLIDILFRYVTVSAITGFGILLLCMARAWINKKLGRWLCFIVCFCVIGANSLVCYGKEQSIENFSEELKADYPAANREGVSMSEDYDMVTAICVDACKEFVRAVRTGEVAFEDD